MPSSIYGTFHSKDVSVHVFLASTIQTQMLNKKEVEDLLRRGAYGAIMDEDDAANK